MAKQKVQKWIIGAGGSDLDGVAIYFFEGTKKEVKKALVKLVKDEKNENIDWYDGGTEKVKDVEERSGSLYAVACFDDHHVDFEAVPFEDEWDTLDTISCF